MAKQDFSSPGYGSFQKLCPACQEEDLKSEVAQSYGDGTVYIGQASCSFWDSAGKLHVHGGESATFYECSRGHRWAEIQNYRCQTCGSGMLGPQVINLQAEGVEWL